MPHNFFFYFSKLVSASIESDLSPQPRRWLPILLTVIGIYLVLAYFLVPRLWMHYDHHPPLAQAPKRTVTRAGIPGDPLNVALIGSEPELIGAMIQAEWTPADPITFHSSLKIAESVVLHHAYAQAPVSNLYLFGRKQDLAFEKIVGGSPRRRHHVRFWRADRFSRQGRPLWVGSATFDRSVGLSRRTGQITHHIDSDIDAERDALIRDLSDAKKISEIFQVTGPGLTLNGRNGGGDWFYTDGELTVGVLGSPTTTQPAVLANPVVVRMKNRLWSTVKTTLTTLKKNDTRK